ncbi:MAG: hypothetical protein NTY08_02370 [Proteobacteria bacterium]|nr:hypothetical protein [Pseudomonadota bacterium]
MSTANRFNSYPMGPQLRSYLGISDEIYAGDQRHVSPSQEESEELEGYLASYRGQAPELSATGLVDLIDELVTMDLPRAALLIASQHPSEMISDDFRARLALGVAAMLCADFSVAEDNLRAAQALLPAEPAPYVNLAQIYLEQQQFELAQTWCLAGLDAEPNHLGLWDLLAEIMREEHGEYLPEMLMIVAEKRCSWAGLSLAANLTTTGDRYLKANLLERNYQQGERDPQFLIELTGAYGIASEFAKIPPLVWQAERLSSKGLPWQLNVHCAQAHLAMDQSGDALTRLNKAEADPQLPDEARGALQELAAEARSSLATTVADALH